MSNRFMDDMDSGDDGNQMDGLPCNWDAPDTHKLLYAALPGLMAALHHHSKRDAEQSEHKRAAEMEASKKAYLEQITSLSHTEEKCDMSPDPT